MIQVEEREIIRRLYFRERHSLRQIAKERHHSRKTVRKAIMEAGPTEYHLKEAKPCPVLDPYKAIVDRWLEEDRQRPRKQRHTGHRVYERLVAECGYRGGESTVRHYVGRQRKSLGELAIPLEFDPGTDAQCDWGESQVIMNGQPIQAQLFCMKLNYSHKPFVMAFPRQKQEAFFEGHKEAFSWFGGVPQRISYDNLTLAVRRVLGGRKREEQVAFIAFRSYYLFDSHFAMPGQAHEQGRIENLVGYARRNFLVPLPRVSSFEELNQVLLERLTGEDRRRVPGEALTIGELWEEERSKLLPLPRYPYPCCVTRPVRANAYSLVAFDSNRYSVPVEYAPRKLTLHAYAWRVEIAWHDRVIAVHRRSYDKGEEMMEVEHYLPLLLQRPGAFPYAKPIRRWEMPPVYRQFLEALKECRNGQAVREFLLVLALGRLHGRQPLEKALSQALEKGWVSYQAVKQLMPEGRDEGTQFPRSALPFRPHLERVKVVFPSLSQFDRLRGQDPRPAEGRP
ncbi:MAG: IS21 family transposase [Dehalococcoidia bacterium]